MRLIVIIPSFVSSNTFGLDCVDARVAENEMAKKLPQKVDEFTTLVEFSVNCDTETVKYVKHLSVDASALPTGAAERKQRQHTNLHCNRQGLASQEGWTVLDYVYDVNAQLVVALRTTPAMCQ